MAAILSLCLEKRQAMRVLLCIRDVDFFIPHREGCVSQSWIQFWIMESKPNSKSVFSLLLRGIGRPLTWPFQRSLILIHSDVTELLSVTFQWESLLSHTLPGHSEGLWHFALHDFFYVYHNIRVRHHQDLLLKVAFQSDIERVRDGRVAQMGLPFMSLQHWGTYCFVIVWQSTGMFLVWERLGLCFE